MLDPIQYEFLFLLTTFADPRSREPEPKLLAPAPAKSLGSGSTTLISPVNN
jgi:hypothetical protein